MVNANADQRKTQQRQKHAFSCDRYSEDDVAVGEQMLGGLEGLSRTISSWVLRGQ